MSLTAELRYKILQQAGAKLPPIREFTLATGRVVRSIPDIKIPHDFRTLCSTFVEVGGKTYLAGILNAWRARQDRPKSKRPHRVYVVCVDCGNRIPAGRIHQHAKVHK